MPIYFSGKHRFAMIKKRKQETNLNIVHNIKFRRPLANRNINFTFLIKTDLLLRRTYWGQVIVKWREKTGPRFFHCRSVGDKQVEITIK